MGEEQVLGATKAVNWLLGKPAAALLALLHVHPANSQYPIPNFFAMELILFVFAVIFFLWLKARISVDRPGGTQQVMEILLTNSMGLGIQDLLDDVVGHGERKISADDRDDQHIYSDVEFAGADSGIYVAHSRSDGATGLRHGDISLLQQLRHRETRRGRIREDTAGTGAGDFADHGDR